MECLNKKTTFLTVNNVENATETLESSIKKLDFNLALYVVCESTNLQKQFLSLISHLKSLRTWKQKKFDFEPVVIFKQKNKSKLFEITELSRKHLEKLAKKLADPSRQQHAVCVSFGQEYTDIVQENIANLDMIQEESTSDETDLQNLGAQALADEPSIFM